MKPKTAMLPRVWSDEHVVCDNCKEVVYLAKWAHARIRRAVIVGMSLESLVLDYHRRSGCVAGTARDLKSRGLSMP